MFYACDTNAYRISQDLHPTYSDTPSIGFTNYSRHTVKPLHARPCRADWFPDSCIAFVYICFFLCFFWISFLDFCKHTPNSRNPLNGTGQKRSLKSSIAVYICVQRPLRRRQQQRLPKLAAVSVNVCACVRRILANTRSKVPNKAKSKRKRKKEWKTYEVDDVSLCGVARLHMR